MGQKSIEERMQRMEAIHEVNNLLSRYEHWLSRGFFDKAVECYAKKTPGVRAEVGPWGVYEGIEGIKKLYLGVHKVLGGDHTCIYPGTMFVGEHNTGVVEVAGDGKTAKGIWYHPGWSAFEIDGKIEANWDFGHRAVDFVKEDGEWKLWHYHVYLLWEAPFYKSWVDTDQTHKLDPPPIPDELKPDRPSTYYRPYNPEYKVENIPFIPVPYETFDEKTAY